MNLVLLILSLPVIGIAADDLCNIRQAAKIEKNIPVPDGVNYFIRGAPGTGQVGFATTKGNFLLDTKSGKMTKAPGVIDPVLTPDGNLVGIPQIWQYNPNTKSYSEPSGSGDGFQFVNGVVQNCAAHRCNTTTMTLDELKKSGKPYTIQAMTFYMRDQMDAGPVLRDDGVNYNYQAFGTLRKKQDKTAYRMLYESKDGLAIRDYEWNEKTKSLKSTGPSKNICESSKGAIPSLNKTGDEFSAYDPDTGTTKVYYIGKSGYECELKNTIPGLVGKADFSPDGKSMVFHVDHRKDNNTDKNVIREASDENQLEAVIYDREKKRPVTLVSSGTENSYYPIFLEDKKLAYISATKPASWQEKPKFVIQVVSIHDFAEPNCPDCYSSDQRVGQLAALVGAVRMQHCDKDSIYYLKNATSSFSQVQPSQCKKLVSGCDEKCFETIKKKIQKESSGGGSYMGGLSLKSKQAWDMNHIDSATSNDLVAFCDSFESANMKTSDPSGAKRGVR